MKRHHGMEDAPAIVVDLGTNPTVPPVDVSPRAALEKLFTLEAKRLVGALGVFTGDGSEAEDIAQEAFARVYANWSKMRETERARSYLYSVAFNLARSRGRRRSIHLRAVTRMGRDDPGLDPETETLRMLGNGAMSAAVAQLPARQRACVVLHYYADLGVADAAAVLGISVNSAKTHLQRALSALRVALAENGERS